MIFAKSGCGMRRILIFLMMGTVCTTTTTESNETTTDGEESRKILGSSDVCICHNGYRKWNESRLRRCSRQANRKAQSS
nr:unnamed protein product [Callosobruchus chinensis]